VKPFHIQEKEKRVKYVRGLERFVKSATALLKREDFDAELFRTRVFKNYTVLSKIEAVPLDSPYTRALEDFANITITTVDKTDVDDPIKPLLQKEANAIEKLKSNASYKKACTVQRSMKMAISRM
jgi:hypothetical protein